MALPGDGVALRLDDPGDNTIEYDASDDRAAMTGLLFPGGAGIASRGGRRPGPPLSVAVGGSPETVTVTPHCGVVTDPDGGAYIYAFPIAVAQGLATRPGSGTSRIDLVVDRIYDADVHAETSLREMDLEVITGTAAAQPVAPTQPDGTNLVATLTVPASGSVSVAVNGPRTVAAGAILPVANQTERDALPGVYDGLMIYREDTDTFEGRIAGTWLQISSSTYELWKGGEGSTNYPGGLAPAGARKVIRQGTLVTNISNSTGGWSVSLGSTFEMPTGLVTAVVSPGDDASGLAMLVLNDTALTKSQLAGIAYRADGSYVPSGSPIRVNFYLAGW